MGKPRVKKEISKVDKNAVYQILDQCYKAGVRDAEYINDASRCKEFIEATHKPHVYGRVIYNTFFDWRRWRLAIVTMQEGKVERNACIVVANKILSQSSYFACLLPLAQCFYNQGLEDWNAYPTIHEFSGLNVNALKRWTRKGIVNRPRKEMFVEIQRFSFDIVAWNEASGDPKAFNSRQFDWFCREVWAQTLTDYDKKGFLMD